MTTSKPDLLVIGGGSGGIAGAIRAARHGARVVLFEPRELGGTCVNRGCVPKKAMWIAAELAEAQRMAAAVGFDIVPGELDWPAFIRRREAYIARARASYDQRLAELGIERVPEPARFIDARSLRAGGREYSAPHILIATGARARPFARPGAELVIDSDGFFRLDACPRRVGIVGGGYIGVELAGVLNALGAEVAMFPRSTLLSRFDADLGKALAAAMRAAGIEVAESSNVAAVRGEPGALWIEGADGARHGPFEVVLNATGRVPNSAGLDLAAAGIETAANGAIVADAFENTNVDGVYAVGDVNGKRELTPVAIAAARRLADRLFGGDAEARLDYDLIPSVVFSHPPIGSVGLDEASARERCGDTVRIHTAAFTPMPWALAERPGRMHMKLVCAGDEERVVGLHGIGPGMDEMLQGFAVALKLGARYRDLLATVAIHPTAAEEFVTMT